MGKSSMTPAFRRGLNRRWSVAAVALAFSVAAFVATLAIFIDGDATAQNVRPPESAVNVEADNNATGDNATGDVPGGALGVLSDSELWRGARGVGDVKVDVTTSLPDPQSRFLIQMLGEDWRHFRNGPLIDYGIYALGGMIALLTIFYLLRGRIRIEKGRAGETVERFTGLERFAHWLMAVSFIILALSGLNLLYGKYFLRDLVGAEAFTQVTLAGKWAHNNVAWAFMIGLALVFLLWVRHNLPSLLDLKWLARGGGFIKGVHADARKFNAGQKLVFWATMLLGISISLSGVALLFPFETQMMGKTFVFLNSVGVSAISGSDLPTNLTAMQEMQYQTQWHAVIGFAMIAVIIAHIYIGTLGMEGAFAAMGSGQVDKNWAREHHNLWLEEVQQKAHGDRAGPDSAPAAGSATPAE